MCTAGDACKIQAQTAVYQDFGMPRTEDEEWNSGTGQNANSCMLTLSDWAECKQLYADTE